MVGRALYFRLDVTCPSGQTPMIMATAFPPAPIATVVIMGRWRF